MSNPLPQIIELPRHLDPRGNLSVIEECELIPFNIRRVHWIYDVPGGGGREGHAYLNNEEFIVALSGSFDVMVNDGRNLRKFSLNRSFFGLYLPVGYWRELTNFSTNAVVLVLSSNEFEKTEYILDFNQYIRMKEEGRI